MDDLSAPDREARQATATVAEELARFAARLHPSDLPAALRDRARLHLLDALGVGLAASGSESAETIVRSSLAMGGEGRHAVIGRGERLGLRDAAQVNGALIHCLDFDDTHGPGVVHVSTAAVPMALAMALETGRDGTDLLLGYLLAAETAARIGAAAGGEFHARGFHPTGVVNAFGTALGAARLLGLDEPALAAAQGIALSLASGSLEFLDNGAWTKRFHAGWAASAGITAAYLAANGFTAPSRPYEGRFGLYALYTRAGAAPRDAAAITRGLGKDWAFLKTGIKPIPACHFIHAFAELAADIAAELGCAGGIPAERIESVLAIVPEGIVSVVCDPPERKHQPANAYEAQFSLPYIVATGLLEGAVTLDALDPPALADPATRTLAARVGYRTAQSTSFPAYFPGELIVTLRDGQEIHRRQEHQLGSDRRPLDAATIEAKFRANAARALPCADAVIEAVHGLERPGGVVRLCDALAVPTRAAAGNRAP